MGQGNKSRVFRWGSRDNPGPGGSGSMVVQRMPDGQGWRPIWAAATALAQCETTNNVAEFVGLQRLLAHAVQRGWANLHVVGDSEMILRMMRIRKAPKAQRLKHWYHVTSQLADRCQVASWTHITGGLTRWRIGWPMKPWTDSRA
jgi:ribonuclease HI